MSKRNKGWTMLLLLVLSVIPGIVLIVQNGINLRSSSALRSDRIQIKQKIQASIEIGRLVHSIQYEGGVTSLYVSTGENDFMMYRQLTNAYERTDEALNALSVWNLPHVTARDELQSKGSYKLHLRHFRERNGSQSLDEVLAFYSSDVQLFIDLMTSAVREERESNIWPDLVAYNMLLNGKESVGQERALGISFFINGEIDLPTLLQYKGAHEMALRYMKKFSEFSVYGKALMEKHINIDSKHVVDSMRAEVLRNTTRDYSPSRGVIWMENMTSYINELDVINQHMENYIEQKTQEEIHDYNLDLVLDIVILLSTLILVPLLLYFIFRIMKKVDTIRKHLEEKTAILELEQTRTETLLSQLVPSKIARKMRNSHVVPEFFSSATVLVSELSNFEMFLRRSTPSELIELVNTVFDVIERRISVFNVSKIGAVGNLLFVASGLTNEHGGEHHVTIMADLALDIMEKTRQIKVGHMQGEVVKLAIGVNTGAVTAGVVHGIVPRYCLYGPTVIEAFKLMTTCLPGQIQISENTYQLLRPSKRYSMHVRDDLAKLKGNENQPLYYVLLGNREKSVLHVDLETDGTCA